MRKGGNDNKLSLVISVILRRSSTRRLRRGMGRHDEADIKGQWGLVRERWGRTRGRIEGCTCRKCAELRARDAEQCRDSGKEQRSTKHLKIKRKE